MDRPRWWGMACVIAAMAMGCGDPGEGDDKMFYTCSCATNDFGYIVLHGCQTKACGADTSEAAIQANEVCSAGHLTAGCGCFEPPTGPCD